MCMHMWALLVQAMAEDKSDEWFTMVCQDTMKDDS